MTMTPEPDRSELLNLTTTIVTSYVAINSIPASDLPGLICRTYEALANISLPPMKADEAATQREPAVPVKKSITDEHLICLEDGKKFKSLRRHLQTQYNLSPQEYRARWGLGPDYPMVAPNYARARSDLAKQIGLGQRHTPQPAVPAAKISVTKLASKAKAA